MIEKYAKLFEWGWICQWYGWRRCLWLAIMLNWKDRHYGVVIFGLNLGYGWRMKKQKFPLGYMTTTTGGKK